jgi:hypothetical protein
VYFGLEIHKSKLDRVGAFHEDCEYKYDLGCVQDAASFTSSLLTYPQNTVTQSNPSNSQGSSIDTMYPLPIIRTILLAYVTATAVAAPSR